jgi:hypothetical protein
MAKFGKASQGKHFGGQGTAGSPNVAPPKHDKVPTDVQAPNNGSSFRGKNWGGTNAHDGKKAH